MRYLKLWGKRSILVFIIILFILLLNVMLLIMYGYVWVLNIVSKFLIIIK